jgi:hypothetical protein
MLHFGNNFDWDEKIYSSQSPFFNEETCTIMSAQHNYFFNKYPTQVGYFKVIGDL